ncbi:MAG TPA: permease-like cell division protein FtsX [Candidatus Saccharibacteria bacterium]|nr:permease-like cell division protein FtsX [Candidatus Saccharibacteria bacterium]
MNIRKLYTFERIFKSGFINLFRNAWLTIAATAVMVVALVIIAIAFVLNVTANNAINVLARDLKAQVYLKDDVNDSQRQNLEKALQNLDFVESIEYVTKSDAKKDLAGNFENDPDLIQAIVLAGEDALPASYKITVTDLDRMPEIKSLAEQDVYSKTVDSVSLGQTDAQATIDKATSAKKFINISSIASAILLSAVSIMIIFNTIRMAIYTRRDEIRIMKLIGATPGYIRGPFLVEASLYGVFAGIIANVTVFSIVLSLGRKVATQREFASTYTYFSSTNVLVIMWLAVIAVGITIGAISSLLAMNRHLRLKNW